MKIYFVQHGLGRASNSTPDADAIVDHVNASVAGSGDSPYRDRVQRELDEKASQQVQELYRITISEQDYAEDE
jgi:hypothetical protein